MSKHLTDDELIDRLYGVGDHAHDCSECAGRLGAMEQKRAQLAAALPVSADFLAAQRRGVYSRLGERLNARWNWAPATAAALCLAAAGVVAYSTSMYHGPARVSAPSVAVSHPDAAADAQLFSDVYAMEQSAEPRAAEPIHALIEEN
jgi:hypothetical protein